MGLCSSGVDVTEGICREMQGGCRPGRGPLARAGRAEELGVCSHPDPGKHVPSLCPHHLPLSLAACFLLAPEWRGLNPWGKHA